MNLTFMDRETLSWRWSSASTASRSVLRRRETCVLINWSSRGPDPSRLSWWITNRPSFPISFFLLHIERLGLDEDGEWKEYRFRRTEAPSGSLPPATRRREEGAKGLPSGAAAEASPAVARRFSRLEEKRSIAEKVQNETILEVSSFKNIFFYTSII